MTLFGGEGGGGGGEHNISTLLRFCDLSQSIQLDVCTSSEILRLRGECVITEHVITEVECM